jgi:superfamily II DNA or RNA helicase
VTCRALDEGMNAPETTVGIIASGTASTRQRIQRLGRILRPAEGKSEAVIYTLYASDQEEERLLAEATDDSLCASVDWLQSGPVA